MLSGVRRGGKSVLLSQIKDEILYLSKTNEEYINLSPNRYDAGDAYLELTFN